MEEGATDSESDDDTNSPLAASLSSVANTCVAFVTTTGSQILPLSFGFRFQGQGKDISDAILIPT